MTTQKLPMLPRGRMNGLFMAGLDRPWTLRPERWGAPMPAIARPPALVAYPVRGDFTNANMNGRRTPLRTPFDTFAASVTTFPGGAECVQGELTVLNDGLRTITLECTFGPPVAPGHVAWPVQGPDAPVGTCATFYNAIANQALDWIIVPQGVVGVDAVALRFYSRRSHPGMYGRGAAWTTQNALLQMNGWGHENTDAGGRNAYGRQWFPTRWGLSRGFTAMQPPPPTPPPPR